MWPQEAAVGKARTRRSNPARTKTGTVAAPGRPRNPMASTPSPVQHTCIDCGQPARVHVLDGYMNGQPVLRHVCAACVEKMVPLQAARRARRPLGLSVTALLGLAGGVLIALGLLGDYLVPSRHPGFGRHQQLGLLVGTVVLGIGLLTRAGVIALAGLLFAAASLCADWLGLTAGVGVGWKQQIMLGGGVLLSLAAVIVHSLRRERHQRRSAREAVGEEGTWSAVESPEIELEQRTT